MINNKLNLNRKVFNKDVEQVPTRDGYGEGLVEAGEKDKRVVALCADLTDSTRTSWFKDKFPERFVEIGVAEQLLVTVGAGMANYGKIPFVASYAAFSPGRNWEQILTTVTLNDVPVKIAGSHAGASVGPDGATHQMLEDIALMRVIPNMVVLSPCDAIQARKVTVTAAANRRPSYIRLTREKTPIITTTNTPFEIGKAQILWESKKPQVAVLATGPLVYESLLAAKDLEKNGIGSIVINHHTIKPIDEKSIVETSKKVKAIVTVEEHQIAGGFGSAVSEVLSRENPTKIGFVGVQDRFGESGAPEELVQKFELDSPSIIQKVKSLLD
ncbi:transketolase family protein [Patescibacteria group bacterium]